ncbi:WecB/TagA/CpsF family glycosyltransferase [Primorskyibacter sp. S87]|uniref:WecB/TagA/CpsF family glycosyltransferase n=1 Tax=Primorskyibacter sp. S87 TaxID=3415126 RepID=UPI003C7E3DED
MQFEFSGQTIAINIPNWSELEHELRARFQRREGFALATVNLDHLAKMTRDTEFVAAYAAQDLVVADGRPVVWLSQLAGQPVDLLPGSEIIEPLCRLAADCGVRVGMVGSTKEALADASQVLVAHAPGLDVALQIAPSGEFDPDGEEAATILERLCDEQIQMCFLALGAPKQEKLAKRGRAEAPSVGFVSIGAGLDFLGGHQVRAPRWTRVIAMEWLWRAMSDPVRLVPRYARCFAILPGQVVQAIRQR